MIKVMFVCHGNICRSPMAMFMFRDLVKRKRLEGLFEIDSSATSREEIGNGVYPPAARKLRSVGIDCKGHRAKQFTVKDYTYFDYILVMESYNISNLRRIIGEDKKGKVHRLLDFSSEPRDIDDSWYTGNFESAYRDIKEGLEGFLNYVMNESRKK